MWAIGGDIHAKTTTFYALDDEGQPVDDFNRRFVKVKSNREGFSCVCRHLAGVDYQILVENSTKTHDVVWVMEELCMNVIVAHTPDLKKIAQSNSKTDRNDAKELAMYLLARFAGSKQFGISYMCSKEDMMDRQLCRMAKLEMMEMGYCTRYNLMFSLKEKAIISPIVQTLSVTPRAIAGVTFSFPLLRLIWGLQKLYTILKT